MGADRMKLETLKDIGRRHALKTLAGAEVGGMALRRLAQPLRPAYGYCNSGCDDDSYGQYICPGRNTLTGIDQPKFRTAVRSRRTHASARAPLRQRPS